MQAVKTARELQKKAEAFRDLVAEYRVLRQLDPHRAQRTLERGLSTISPLAVSAVFTPLQNSCDGDLDKVLSTNPSAFMKYRNMGPARRDLLANLQELVNPGISKSIPRTVELIKKLESLPPNVRMVKITKFLKELQRK